MNLFIKKISIFLSILLIFIVVLSSFNKLFFRYNNPFVLDKKINTLILGDSHTKYALNDKILKNTCNFSNDADSYFYSYQKLKQIVKVNPSIDTILLSFSIHNIHKCIEERWVLNNGHMNNRLQIYLPLLDSGDLFFFFKNKPKELFANLFKQIKFIFFLKIKGKYAYGGYRALEHNDLRKEIEKQKKNGFREEYTSFIESPIEKEYLGKIIDYCQLNNLNLFLINPPLYKTLQDKQDYLFQFYKENFPSTNFLDFSKIKVKDQYFGDLVHLNSEGAVFFSNMIENEGLLNINNLDKVRTHNNAYEKLPK